MLGDDDVGDSVSAAATSLQGGNLSENSLESAVDDVKEATETLADDLEDAGKPDTEDGQRPRIWSISSPRRSTRAWRRWKTPSTTSRAGPTS